MSTRRSSQEEGVCVCGAFAVCALLFFTIPPIGFILWAGFICYMGLREKTRQSTPFDADSDSIIIEELCPSHQSEDAYEIPLICPTCGNQLELNSIKWIDKDTGICPHCESVINAK